jgi:succinate-semialdehyde dehydrogenase/glutarate-semialdehyde dehydrogenase
VAAKAAAILRERVDEFARPMTLEMGKRIDEARGEVAAGITAILAS